MVPLNLSIWYSDDDDGSPSWHTNLSLRPPFRNWFSHFITNRQPQDIPAKAILEKPNDIPKAFIKMISF